MLFEEFISDKCKYKDENEWPVGDQRRSAEIKYNAGGQQSSEGELQDEFGPESAFWIITKFIY